MREEASPVCVVVNICDRGHPTIAPPAYDRLGESEWVITVRPDPETAITGLYQSVRYAAHSLTGLASGLSDRSCRLGRDLDLVL